MPAQNPLPLFQELKTMHRALFQEQFERLEWGMVASFETIPHSQRIDHCDQADHVLVVVGT